MAIREITQDAPAPTPLAHELVRITLTPDRQLLATWLISLTARKRRECTVVVGAELTAAILARPSFQELVDAIKLDTFPRTGAPAAPSP